MKFIAKLVVRRPKTVFFGFVASILLSATLGLQVFSLLTAGGYENPNSDSARVSTLLKDTFKQSQPELIGILDFPRSAENPLSYAAGQSFQDQLKGIDGIEEIDSYYSVTNLAEKQAMKSKDGNAVYFFIDFDDSVNSSELVAKVQDQFQGSINDATVYFAGMAAVTSEINSSIGADLALAESFAVPVMILLMLVVFGSLVAAGLPLLVGGLGILGSFVFLWISAQFGDTSVFAVNMITGLGLGLGIDYALLIVNRYREERATGKTVQDAVHDTVLSAGRTVLFSGLTVAIVMGALNFFPQGFLKSMCIGGIAVVFTSLGGALLALPALLCMLGDRVDKFRLFKPSTKPDSDGFWADVARAVMGKPIRVVVVSLLGLGFLASLVSGAVFSQVDDRILPEGNRVVAASDVIRERFAGREASPLEILVKGSSASEREQYAMALSKKAHVISVRSEQGLFMAGMRAFPYMPDTDPTTYSAGDWHRLIVVQDVEPRSPEGLKNTVLIRGVEAKGIDEILVGGSAAVYTDSQQGVENNLWAAALWVALSTFVLLFLFTGSILLPIKAVILNFLSLSATIGFLTWTFMNGNLKEIIGDYQTTGTVDTSTTVLIAVLVFGLSMDYELFLLSRIKEEHEAGHDTTESVALGLQKSGRIITAAALVLAVSFISFITSGVTMIKMMGIGIAFAILLDATIVRALLVPALMRLFGSANWWAPKWAKKIAEKAGFSH
jgi:RND superfamily putative drug exporter